MIARPFIATICFSLILALTIPASLIMMPPQRAQAVNYPDLIADLLIALQYVEDILVEVSVVAQEALEYLFYVKEYVLEPLAFIQSGKALQGLTGGMLAFVSGGSNGTGQSQFVQNLPGHLQGVGDNTTQSFLRQFSRNSNSPYAGAIASSLRTNYLQQSSLGGFFAANRDTLPQYAKNATAFLGGNWSQGGVSAWFALTTQPQNNPYALHQRAQSQLGLLIETSVTSHLEQINWGQGFLSWCGAGEPAKPNVSADCNVANNFCGGAVPVGGDEGAANPGATCTQEDGTPGIVKTPGTTITNYLDKSLGLDADKLNKLGNASTQITSLVGSIMETVQMAQTVISGPQGGLAGVGTQIEGRSIIDQYTSTTTPYAGVNQCSINKTSAASPPSNGTELLSRTGPYVTAWIAIGTAARTASTTVTELRDFCTAQVQIVAAKSTSKPREEFIILATSIANQAQQALMKGSPDGIVYVLTKASAAAAIATEATEFVQKVRDELSAPGVGTPPVCQDYSADVQKLRTLPPTAQDMALASKDAINGGSGSASTTPAGSLVLVSYQGSLVDKMNLLSANATALKAACVIPLGV